MTKEIDLYQENYLSPLCEIASNIISITISMYAIFMIQWKLAIVFIGISMLTIVLSQLPSKFIRNATENYSKVNADYMDKITNVFKDGQTIRLLSVQNVVQTLLFQQIYKMERGRGSFLFARDGSKVVTLMFSLFSQFLCMAAGIWFVMQGNLTIGLLLASVQLLNGVFTPLQYFMHHLNLIKSAASIRQELSESTILKEESQKTLEPSIQTITLKNIFLKLNEKIIFDHLNYTFERGKKYAIIGPSGVGKSTLMKLILGYFPFEMYEGDLLINGEKNRSNVESKIGFVQSNTFFIQDSVEKNITLSRSGLKAIPKSLLHFSDRFLDKIVGRSGENLSLGEKQRINLARILIKQFDVYIFDEPVSNLDPELSTQIMNDILNISNAIVIIITHDQSRNNLDQFDEVLELQ